MLAGRDDEFFARKWTVDSLWIGKFCPGSFVVVLEMAPNSAGAILGAS